MKKALNFCLVILAAIFAIPAFACTTNPCPPPPPLPDCTTTVTFQGGTFARAVGGNTGTFGMTEAKWDTSNFNGATKGSAMAGAASTGPGESTAQTGAFFAERRDSVSNSSSLVNQGELMSKGGQVAGEMINSSTLTAWPGDSAKVTFGGGYEGANNASFFGGSDAMFTRGTTLDVGAQ